MFGELVEIVFLTGVITYLMMVASSWVEKPK